VTNGTYLSFFWMAIQSDSFAEYGARLGHQGEGLGSSLDDPGLNAPGPVGDTLLADQRKQNPARVVCGVIEPMALPSVVKLQHMLETKLSRPAARKLSHLVDTSEVELSGMFRPGGSHEEVAVHRDPDRLDSQAV
jgi:hypothetical protein